MKLMHQTQTALQNDETALQNAPRDKHDNILHHQKPYLNPFHDLCIHLEETGDDFGFG